MSNAGEFIQYRAIKQQKAGLEGLLREQNRLLAEQNRILESIRAGMAADYQERHASAVAV